MRNKYNNLRKELEHYERRLSTADGIIEKQYLKIAIRHIRMQMDYMAENYYIPTVV